MDLVKILWELGMLQIVFNLNAYGLEDECFMAEMRDLVLHHAPSASFGSLMAILTPYVGHCINDATTMVVNLGEAETQWQQKGVWMVSLAPSVSQAKNNPVWVTSTQMWVDLLGSGIDRSKIDGKQNAYKLELWKQL